MSLAQERRELYKRRFASIFHEYNPNPKGYKHSSDCVFRAFCSQLDIAWEDAYDMMCYFGKKVFDSPTSTRAINKCLKALEYKEISRRKGEPKFNVLDVIQRAKQNDETIFCFCNGHVFTVKKGNVYDMHASVCTCSINKIWIQTNKTFSRYKELQKQFSK